MMQPFAGFVGPTYQSRSIVADCQRTMNLYPEVVESGTGKARIVFHRVPGLRAFSTLPTSPVRGIHESNGVVVVAAGNYLYRLLSSGSYSPIGEIAAGAGPVSIASNGEQFFICSEGHGYLFDGSTLTSAGPDSPGQVVFIDGYFVTFSEGTQTFWFSGLYDGSTWDGLDFGSAESDPDNLVALIADHREAWMFGSKSIEPFGNAGSASLVFERIQGASIEQGCGAKWSVAKLDNSLFWLGADDRGGRALWRANGYTPIRVSNHAVEYAWSKYPRVDDAVAFGFMEEGHAFYQITFPSAQEREYPHLSGTIGATWVYDCATQLWHQRGRWDPNLGEYRQHRALCHCHVWGKHLVGDYASGTIYEQTMDVHTDGSDALRWERTAPHLSANGDRVFFSRLQLDMETGQGLTSGQGSDPKVGMQFSDDGGRTWSNERTASSGRRGEYRKRVEWNRLGSARDRVFRIYGSDPVPTTILGAYLEASAGAH